MKAPDKIYLNTPKIQPELDNTTWDTKPYADCENVEYIRKDALLEWAKEQASITEKLNGRGAMLKAWDTLIDKIESL